MAFFPLPSAFLKTTYPLWDGSAPFRRGDAPDDIPTLSAIFPGLAGSASPAVLIVPGGGYEEHAFDCEIIRLCERFREQGISSFILRYRLASDGYRHPVQLLDARRALRLLRHRAPEWNVDPSRVAVMGFSAGGHLASMLATHCDTGIPDAADPVDRESARPDAAVLVYPVIAGELNGERPGSILNLLGAGHDPALLAYVSSDRNVTSQTPPTLLIHGEDDATVSVEHSRRMAAALEKAGVPSELHVYPSGKHGFGCFAADLCPFGWLERVFEWLKKRGIAK